MAFVPAFTDFSFFIIWADFIGEMKEVVNEFLLYSATPWLLETIIVVTHYKQNSYERFPGNKINVIHLNHKI